LSRPLSTEKLCSADLSSRYTRKNRRRNAFQPCFHELYHITGFDHGDPGPNRADQQGKIMAEILLLYADKEREALEKLHSDSAN
jgi:hypothetical protein